MYIELHAASAFSFLQGASLPETLVERAAALGYPALALLDADGVYGAPRFHKAAQQGRAARHHRRGADDRARGTGRRADRQPHGQPQLAWRLPVLVASAEGYRNLCRLVTRMKMRAAERAKARSRSRSSTASPPGSSRWPGRPLLDAQHYGVGGLLDRLVGLFGRGNVYVELQRHLLRDEESDNAALTQLAQAFRVPVVATNGVRFADAGRSAAVRRAHLRPPPHHARRRRPPAGAQRRALSEVARGDGAAVRAIVPTRSRAPRRWPSGSSTRWPISATAFRRIRCRPARPRCRSCATSPRPARAIATARITTRRARRSPASSI